LPLDLEISLDKNNIAFAVNDLIESIPEETFEDSHVAQGVQHIIHV